MLGHHLRIALVFPTAYALVDAVAIEHLAGMLRQECDDVELAPRQLHRPSGRCHGARAVVDGDVAVEAYFGAHVLAVVAGKMRLHARSQHG